MAGLFGNQPPYRRGLGGQPPKPVEPPLVKATYDRPGVYMFLKRGANGAWVACYIGETENFNRRLNTDLALHHRWTSIRAEGATHIGTLHVPGALAPREAIETDLRRAIDTPCNRQ